MGNVKEKMGDEDLEALRAQRMAELQAQMGGAPGGGGDREQQEEMRRQQAEMKHQILHQVLDQQARARLNTIALTKPDKAAMVENALVQMARSGQIQSKMSEAQFKGSTQQTSVKFDRRRAALDSDSD